MQFLTFNYQFIRQNTFFKIILRFILQKNTIIETVIKKYKSTQQKRRVLSIERTLLQYFMELSNIKIQLSNPNYQQKTSNRQHTTKKSPLLQKGSSSILYKIFNS